MIRWEAPGPYVVAFTTRVGGVSEGPFASLNLGSKGDDPDPRGREPAPRLRGARARRRAARRQPAAPFADRAPRSARRPGEPGDGLWTDEPGLPMLALSADCLPIAIASTNGHAALAVVHAGWRGLAEGIVGAAVAALAGAPAAAVIGPAVGPCCYEVGPEVSARFDADLTRDGIPRPLERRRAGAAPRRRRARRAARPLHALQPGALLLASPRRPDARRAGSDRRCRRLRCASATSAFARRSGPA